MALGKIAKILVGDLEPEFKRFRIGLTTDYEWGSGWPNHLSSVAFDNVMYKFFSSNGWHVREPEDSGGCITARKHGQYLYLHPMEISGYIRPENLTELRDIVSLVGENIIHSHDEGRLGEDVYALSDCAVVRLFADHKKEIWEALEPLVNENDPKYLNNHIFDELLEDTVIPRNDELSGICLSSASIEYGMLVNEAATLLEMRERQKDKPHKTTKQKKPFVR